MNSMGPDFEPAASPCRSADAASAPPPNDLAAWELIDAGRYMPRRIRGSHLGRELG
jgi:hypothetical protein